MQVLALELLNGHPSSKNHQIKDNWDNKSNMRSQRQRLLGCSAVRRDVEVDNNNGRSTKIKERDLNSWHESHKGYAGDDNVRISTL
jgi:hypothetical protein